MIQTTPASLSALYGRSEAALLLLPAVAHARQVLASRSTAVEAARRYQERLIEIANDVATSVTDDFLRTWSYPVPALTPYPCSQPPPQP